MHHCRTAVVAWISLLVVAIIALRLISPYFKGNQPGALKATQVSLHWQSPDPSAGLPASRYTPTFELVNVGGSPVRIKSVQTSCGCATARAEPEIVPPWGKSSVTVNMDSLEVGVRAATITLETDAPSTPQVPLQLIAEGYRRPPYVFQINADLYYQAGYTDDDVRKVLVDTVVLRGIPADPPALSTDVQILQFGKPTIAERPYIADPDMLVRSYTFPVRFAKHPPEEGFSGEVRVADPWVRGRVLRARLFGERNLPIRAIPTRLILDASGGDARPRPIRFLAKSKDGGMSLKAVTEGDDSPLLVEADAEGASNQYVVFRVSWRPGKKIKEGIFNIILRPASGGSASLTVPVQVRVRGG